jgi:hypothetical protein
VGDDIAGGRRYTRRHTPVSLRVRAGLEGAFPPVWRRLDVASDLGLVDLHDVLQAVFGWEDRHLHRFATGPDDDPGSVFAGTAELATALDDDADRAPTWDVRLDELLARPGDRLHYRYDYGDDWHVVLELEDVTAAVPSGRVELVEGAGKAPPEDCGGIGGHRMLVAATDPDHPDHARARRDVAQLWGAEVTPERFGLVPFDPDAVARRLAGLDLPARPPVPRRVGPQLTQLLLRVRDTRTERQVLALASAADGPVDVDRDTTAAALRPLQVLLDAVGEGVKLTAAGYLPPAVVEQVFTELRLDEVWIGRGNREDLTLPVLELREATQQLGLLRKHTGRLSPTARWGRLRDDPIALWWHVAGRLPLSGRGIDDAGWQAGVLLLALVATGDTERILQRVGGLLTDLGWAVGGQPIDRSTVVELVRADLALLERLGALADRRSSGRWPGEATPTGITFARAVLSGRDTS